MARAIEFDIRISAGLDDDLSDNKMQDKTAGSEEALSG